MANKAIGWTYAVLGTGVVVTLIFGNEAVLSIDWLAMIAGKVLEGLWQGSPTLCIVGVFAAGWSMGYRIARREQK